MKKYKNLELKEVHLVILWNEDSCLTGGEFNECIESIVKLVEKRDWDLFNNSWDEYLNKGFTIDDSVYCVEEESFNGEYIEMKLDKELFMLINRVWIEEDIEYFLD